MTVKASNDDEYFTFSDFEMAQAYYYWSLYGLTADTSSNYTDTYSTTGTITSHLGFSGAIDASLSGNLATKHTLTGFVENHISWNVDLEPNAEISIDPVQQQPTSTTGCTFTTTTSSTTERTTGTCTTQESGQGYEMRFDGSPDTGSGGTIVFKIKADGDLDSNGNPTTSSGYSFDEYFLSGVNTGTQSLSGTMGADGNITGTLNITSTTTTTNTNSLKYVFPLVKGTYKRPDTSLKRYQASFYLNKDNPFTVAFMTPSTTTFNDTNFANFLVPSESDPSQAISGLLKRTQRYLNNPAFYIRVYELDPNFPYDNIWGDVLYISYSLPSSITNNGFIPLYAGYKNYMSDGMYRFLYGNDRNIEAINKQTQQQAIQHQEIMDTSQSSQVNNIGNDLISDTNTKMGDLFFPITHAIDTANDLANVQATNKIRLPAIFADGYWYLDLSQIEEQIPDAWIFIQSLCQLCVALYIFHGLYNIVFGGHNDS